MKSVYLLDVNLVVALFWEAHRLNAIARAWFKTRGHHGWATCPITEAGFVRITSNPAFSRDAATPQQAMSLLAENANRSHHTFWPNDLSYADAVALYVPNIVGHQQITDAYLLGLAIHHGGKLATFDRAIVSLLPPSSPHTPSVEIVGS